MKTLIVLFVMMTGFIFSQENPWQKKGENPWKNYETTSQKKLETANSDSLQNGLEELISADSLLSPLPQTKVETVKVTTLYQTERELGIRIQNQSDSMYYNRGDFTAGLVLGLLFGVYGLAGDGIYAAAWNEKERQIVQTFKSDSTYQSLSEKQIKKNTKKTTGNKKFRHAAKGTAVAVTIRVGVILIAIAANF